MCGIVGVMSASPIEADVVAAMRDRLVHRGPDDAGLWLSPDRRLCLGFRRLAIVDLSPDANQPFHSHDGRFTIVFNGEIYNFRELGKELAGRGVVLRTRSDTEVLVEAFRAWGEQCLERFSGMFAFALWDSHTRSLFCARDRAGEKPFYYAEAGGAFLFASELKALTLWPGFRRALCYPALADFLHFGFVADPKSIWEGCHKLAPGHCLRVALPHEQPPEAGAPRAWWDLEFNPDHAVADWGPAIRDALESAGKEMSYADVPVGAFLSGGVDSSSVVAALSRAGCSVRAFTVGFDEPNFDERSWAREVSTRYRLAHTERVVRPTDVGAAFDRLLWHYDEPFNDYSYLPTYYLCREARQVVTVALSGDGGDEMFAGYSKYARLARMGDLRRFLPRPAGALLAGGARLLLPEINRTRRTVLQYTSDTPAMLADMLALGLSSTALRRAARGPLAECLRHYSPQEVVDALLQKAPPREVGLINAMRYLDLKLTLAGDILVKVDRASMAVSLEVRPVYLNRGVIELAARIPPGALADRRQAKKALKAALRPWLPDSVLTRRKMGFAMPLQNWIGTDLGELVRRQADGTGIGEILDPSLLERTLEAHSSGTPHLTAVLHSLVFLEHWLDRWTKPHPATP